MIYADAVLIGLGLAMDAAAVSAANGLRQPNMKTAKLLLIAGAFGLFQGFMPAIGYFAGSVIADRIASALPFLSLALLAFLGGKMIFGAVRKKSAPPSASAGAEIGANSGAEKAAAALPFRTLLVQAFATSVDALTVGVLYVENAVFSALVCFAIFAAVTFAVSAAAVAIGRKAGEKLSNKAEIVGGIILIAIGVKILVESLI